MMPLSACFANVKRALGLASLCLSLPLHASEITNPSAATTAAPQAVAQEAQASPPAPNTMRIHYRRKNADEAKWGVYSWEGPKQPSKTWIADRFMFTQKDGFGGWVDIPLAEGKVEIRFLLSNEHGHKNCNTDQNKALRPDIAQRGQEIWITQASCAIHDQAPATS